MRLAGAAGPDGRATENREKYSMLLKYCNILKQTLKNRRSVWVYLNILVLRAKRGCEVAALPRCRAQ